MFLQFLKDRLTGHSGLFYKPTVDSIDCRLPCEFSQEQPLSYEYTLKKCIYMSQKVTLSLTKLLCDGKTKLKHKNGVNCG